MPDWLDDDKALLRTTPVYSLPFGTRALAEALKRAHAHIDELRETIEAYCRAESVIQIQEGRLRLPDPDGAYRGMRLTCNSARDLLNRDEPPEVK